MSPPSRRVQSLRERADLERHFLRTLGDMQQLMYAPEISRSVLAVHNKDIVIFLGNTRSGKSTCVNFFMGNRLLAVRVRKSAFSIVKADSGSAGPDIGEGSLSKTTLPTVWTSSKARGLVVDAPGFDDNRGEAQDVANAFYIKEMISSANSVKFVLVCDINDITGNNVSQFVSLIGKVHTMFSDSEHLAQGMALVFTKDRDSFTKDDTCHMLRDKIINQFSMKVANRDLLKYFINNKNQIAIVRMPTAEGHVSAESGFDDLVDTVERRVSRLAREVLPTVQPPIADKSLIFLLATRNALAEWRDLDEALREVHSEFGKKVEAATAGPGAQAKDKLTQLQKQLAALRGQEPRAQLASLRALLPNVAILAEDSTLFTKLNFVNFIDQVLEMEQSSTFTVKLNATITAMLESITHKRIQLQEQLLEVSREEAERIMQQVQEDNRLYRENLQRELESLKRSNEIAAQKQGSKFGFGDFLQAAGQVASTVVTIRGFF